MVPGMIIRGGTSKGIYINKKDMPANRTRWDDFLLDIMGSPDPRQIDGLGGANSLTSKAAIIGLSERPDADVDYTFAQVSITDRKVDTKGNCGNLSSAVGLYAVESGMVEACDGMMSIRVYNTNTDKIIINTFTVREGRVVDAGDAEIPGVPGTAAPIRVTFTQPEGAVTGKLLPTGKARQRIETSFNTMEISIVDAANPLVFMNANDLGLKGNESVEEYTKENLAKIEEVRSIAADLCGFAQKERATKESPAVPKATVIALPQRYTTHLGKEIDEEDCDLLVRMMSMQKPHQALAVTGAVCLNIAARTEGTLVHKIARSNLKRLLMGHPGGVMETDYYEEEGRNGVTVLRTARIIMSGDIHPKGLY